MKLNKQGQKLYDKWEHIYYDELVKIREQTNDPDFCEGWCIIDDWDHIHNIDDEIGLLIFGYEDDAIYHIIETVNSKWLRPDEEWMFGKSCREMIELLKPYFDIDENENLNLGE